MTRLKKLFLVNNKINKIENISSLHQLQMLELGSNRIRVGACGQGRCSLGRAAVPLDAGGAGVSMSENVGLAG